MMNKHAHGETLSVVIVLSLGYQDVLYTATIDEYATGNLNYI